MPISEMVIPPSQRYGKLRESIFSFVDSLVALREKNPNLPPGQTSKFLLLAYPWLAAELIVEPAHEEVLGQNRRLLSGLGFQGEKIYRRIARDTCQ